MIKREFKVNLMSFITWLAILAGIFIMVFLVYPYIISDENVDLIEQMMGMFPEELLVAFNMDIATIDSAFGWIKSEGLVFLLLICSSYAGILGSNIILKEESNKTIEYLNSLPVTRKQIAIHKIIVGLTYVLALVIGITIINFIGLALSGDFDVNVFLLLSLSTVFPVVITFSLCLFISTFMHKTSKMMGITLGIVFVSYFLNVLAGISSNVEFLKYFSIFSLADTRSIIINETISFIPIIIFIVLSSGFITLSVIRYNKKELV